LQWKRAETVNREIDYQRGGLKKELYCVKIYSTTIIGANRTELTIFITFLFFTGFINISCAIFFRLDMVEIKGKRGRKVPVLLTKEVRKAIDILVEKRSEVGVNPDNPYLFAAPGNGSLGHLRPGECIRKVVMSENLQLEKPEAVTSTRLRKYVATVSQILDLQENELDWLARHLGHDITVHREYYRLHESTIELAKVGKILTTVDEGKTSQWAGKSLDQIDLNKDIDPIVGKF